MPACYGKVNAPNGTAAPCVSEPGGCRYDSLNVGIKSYENAPYVGDDLDDSGFCLDSTTQAYYCDSGATNVLRAATPCWVPYRPLGEIRVDVP